MNSENIINTIEKLIYWSGERYKLVKDYGTNLNCIWSMSPFCL